MRKIGWFKIIEIAVSTEQRRRVANPEQRRMGKESAGIDWVPR